VSLVGRNPVHVYFGLHEGGISSQSDAVEWIAYENLESGLPLLFEKVGCMPRKVWQRNVPVHVWLSGAFARPFLFGPLVGVQTWDEVIAVAEAAAPDASGVEGPCAVQVEAWPDKHPTLATAIRKPLLDAIELAASQNKVRIRSLKPWWSAALNHLISAKPSSDLACINDQDSMILFGGLLAQLNTVNSYVPRMSSDQTEKLLSRRALVSGTPVDDVPRIALARTADSPSVQVPFGAVEGSL
jgi:hypothetical protein